MTAAESPHRSLAGKGAGTVDCWQEEESVKPGSSLKKVSLLAYGREEDQKENEEEGREKIKEAEKRELMRDGGRADAISQNWRDRTSAVFAVSSS